MYAFAFDRTIKKKKKKKDEKRKQHNLIIAQCAVRGSGLTFFSDKVNRITQRARVETCMYVQMERKERKMIYQLYAPWNLGVVSWFLSSILSSIPFVPTPT